MSFCVRVCVCVCVCECHCACFLSLFALFFSLFFYLLCAFVTPMPTEITAKRNLAAGKILSTISCIHLLYKILIYFNLGLFFALLLQLLLLLFRDFLTLPHLHLLLLVLFIGCLLVFQFYYKTFKFGEMLHFCFPFLLIWCFLRCFCYLLNFSCINIRSLILHCLSRVTRRGIVFDLK